MENTVEYEGYWWLPGQQERDVSGTLRYNPSVGITLDTLGPLVEGWSETSGDREQHSINLPDELS